MENIDNYHPDPTAGDRAPRIAETEKLQLRPQGGTGMAALICFLFLIFCLAAEGAIAWLIFLAIKNGL